MEKIARMSKRPNRFSISFLDRKPFRRGGEKYRWGMIQIGSFQEEIHILVENWTVDSYKKQWQEALKRTMSGYKRSCLITEAGANNKYFGLWPVYRFGNEIKIQMRYLKKKNGTSITNPYKHIGVFNAFSGKDKISTWTTNIDAVKTFNDELTKLTGPSPTVHS